MKPIDFRFKECIIHAYFMIKDGFVRAWEDFKTGNY